MFQGYSTNDEFGLSSNPTEERVRTCFFFLLILFFLNILFFNFFLVGSGGLGTLKSSLWASFCFPIDADRRTHIL